MNRRQRERARLLGISETDELQPLKLMPVGTGGAARWIIDRITRGETVNPEHLGETLLKLAAFCNLNADQTGEMFGEQIVGAGDAREFLAEIFHALTPRPNGHRRSLTRGRNQELNRLRANISRRLSRAHKQLKKKIPIGNLEQQVADIKRRYFGPESNVEGRRLLLFNQTKDPKYERENVKLPGPKGCAIVVVASRNKMRPDTLRRRLKRKLDRSRKGSR